ncbi:MAG: gluconeogenesis factor YvcK family protein [Patescibacteria group bacterium]
MIRLNKKVLAMGGGTGTYTVLSGLRQREVVSLSCIVTMADNGGSSGELRDELGVLPAGDILRCMIALSDAEPEWRQTLEFRFDAGKFEGHRFGNVFLAALQKQYQDPLEGISIAHKLLRVQGNVIPVTTRAGTLQATLEDDTLIQGEHEIDESAALRSPIKAIALLSEEPANPAAVKAIEEADLIVIGPGDLFTSIIPVLLVPGINEALARTKAKKVYVINLMTKRGQTEGYSVTRFCQTLEKYSSPARMDYVIINRSVPSDEVVALYAAEGEAVVEDDYTHPTHPLQRVCRESLLAPNTVPSVSGDRLRRSLVRHDPVKLARAILSLIRE